MRRLFSILSLSLLVSTAAAQPRLPVKDGARILFLGDSNTFAGGFITYLDAFLFARFPDRKLELINLGLPSETVSGLSEPDHPYPRPNVHDRLEAALKKTKPDLVVACYGMNDGIYYPFAKERLEKFEQGYGRLIARVLKDKVPLVILTPMPFDAAALKGKLAPKGEPKYSWLKPYEGYDVVLAVYSEWLREMKKPAGVQVVDVHQEAIDALRLIRGFKDKGFILSGDGIHPGPLGHLLAAGALGRALGLFEPEPAAELEAREGTVVAGPLKNVRSSADQTQWTWDMGLALPYEPAWKFGVEDNSTVRALAKGPVLKITGLPWKKARLFEGEKFLGEVEADKDGSFTIVPYRFPNFSRFKDSQEFMKAVRDRQRLLGLAWLTDVGHKRPDTPKGAPLDEAKKKAAALEERIRALARRREATLSLTPILK
ncbi:MAG: SGNH/GDSL hydrolase family protein [Gemmataceae bacterium]